jgi:hypothetical protein
MISLEFHQIIPVGADIVSEATVGFVESEVIDIIFVCSFQPEIF